MDEGDQVKDGSVREREPCGDRWIILSGTWFESIA